MTYRLLVTDIDGTLVNAEGAISPRDADALARVRRAGIRVALSTGRVREACRKVAAELALDGYHIFFDGALVADLGGNDLHCQPIDAATIGEMVHYARAGGLYLELYSARGYFVERETRATEIHRRFFDLEPKVGPFDGLLEREKIIKAEMMPGSPDEARKARQIGERFNGRLHFSWARTPAYPGVDFVNVVSPEVSKGRALEALTRHLGMDLSETVAIGDGPNDVSLLAAAGLAIAMQDAPEELKAVADHVTRDVAHSGLAEAIDRFLP